VIGYLQDAKALALICTVNETPYRLEGFEGIYHITHSLAGGVKPVYSNELIQKEWITIKPRFRVFGTVELNR
jgi:hypothetical protein